MGFDDACFRDSEDDMIRTLLDSPHPFVRGITLEELDRERFVRLSAARAVPAVRRRAASGLPTGSAISGAETLDYTPPVESRHGDTDSAAEVSAGADFAQERRQHELDLRPSRRRGSADRHPAPERRTDAAPPGDSHDPTRCASTTIAAPASWWRRWTIACGRAWSAPRRCAGASARPDRRNVNALTSERLTDTGGGPTFYSCLVEVERIGD